MRLGALEEARILRQDRDLDRDYRTVSSGDDHHGGRPETHYAESGGIHIAFQVLGEGPLDLVVVPGLVSHLDLWWQDRTANRFFRGSPRWAG